MSRVMLRTCEVFFYVLGRVSGENTFDTYWVCKMDEIALLSIRKPQIYCRVVISVR